ncbi:hypothetical protein A3B51_03150 [Candidatus Curtissbacteria bacterium RIFCSPLOWO2_01_FULL_41_18]|uniref:Uncharacterized protein n=2 Tax=Candidatus Curtissiibacteriota TaxID=1752717 RepID=A0A1F5G2Q3_9BACT|nr:MAG: hypothetical protein A2696_02345 [Candidatus Curtissbacteria bacterium RIFCSPHIGHO2_01_FULL_41_13]OGE04010.1 MAG: hypothetical protein A3B51_03150 [Candidatus Curtissbacteria bacterium RIFCSPLOWO2_01_FULL_41_18]
MNDQETGVIEGTIVAEENLTPEQKNAPKVKSPKKLKTSAKKLFENVKKEILSLKKPRLMTIIILFVSIITVYVALVVFLSQQPKETDQSIIPISSPTFQTNIKNEPEEITSKKEQFYKNLESLDSDLRNSIFPQVDLNITF